jgi:hypothetical protein
MRSMVQFERRRRTMAKVPQRLHVATTRAPRGVAIVSETTTFGRDTLLPKSHHQQGQDVYPNVSSTPSSGLKFKNASNL